MNRELHETVARMRLALRRADVELAALAEQIRLHCDQPDEQRPEVLR